MSLVNKFRSRLYGAEQYRQRQALKALAKSCTALRNAAGQDERLAILCQLGCELSGAKRGLLLGMDAQGQAYRPLALAHAGSATPQALPDVAMPLHEASRFLSGDLLRTDVHAISLGPSFAGAGILLRIGGMQPNAALLWLHMGSEKQAFAKAGGTRVLKGVDPVWLHMLATLLGLALAAGQELNQAAKLRSRVKELEQLELVARLAGGVAHDVNNALTVIMGNAEYIQRALPLTGELDKAYQQMLFAVDHASSLARNLLALGRRAVDQVQLVEIDRAIHAAEPRFSSYLGPEIKLHLLPGAPGAAVEIDPSQLEQCLINLLLNAKEAMEGCGNVRLGTSLVTADDQPWRGLPGDGTWLRICVADEGPGVAPDLVARIREPFFTGKNLQMHSGIGLATVDLIVRRFGGTFTLRSEPGAGTSAIIQLPALPAKKTDSVNIDAEEVPSDWGGVKVMVVDDHQPIRELTAAIFREYGCTVLEADSGEQALSLAGDEQDVDLLVSDVMMPGMDGPELAQRMREQIPHLRAMFISGYADGKVMADYLRQNKDSFLGKPYTRAQLIARAYECLRA